jgi:hypothetical protein
VNEAVSSNPSTIGGRGFKKKKKKKEDLRDISYA